MLTLQQITALKRDAYKPNYGSKAYSPSTVISLIEVIERYVGEIPVDDRRPRDPFDLSNQVSTPAVSTPDQPGLFDSFINGNFSNNSRERHDSAMGAPVKPLFSI